jgi:hypothetical protein
MQPKPAYSYKTVEYNHRKFLVIVDNYCDAQPTLTVTNAVEDVLEAICKELGSLPPYIIYRDSEQEWCRLSATTDGEFLGFMPLGERVTEEYVAVERVIDSEY